MVLSAGCTLESCGIAFRHSNAGVHFKSINEDLWGWGLGYVCFLQWFSTQPELRTTVLPELVPASPRVSSLIFFPLLHCILCPAPWTGQVCFCPGTSRSLVLPSCLQHLPPRSLWGCLLLIIHVSLRCPLHRKPFLTSPTKVAASLLGRQASSYWCLVFPAPVVYVHSFIYMLTISSTRV